MRLITSEYGIGIVQVTRHQPCTFENSSFHFHYALHLALEEISG